MFESVRQDKLLSDRIVDQILRLFENEELTPGNKLPTERDLADQFGVSRTVVREALKTLRAKGVVDIQQGSGVTVTSLSPEHVVEAISLFLQTDNDLIKYKHIAELRQIIEIEIAGIAAQRATTEDLTYMEIELSTMEALSNCVSHDVECRQQFADADVQFHLALAMATGNPLLLVVFKPLMKTLVKQRFRAFAQTDAIEHALVYHREILEAVKLGDVVKAKEAMHQHLEQSLLTMEQVGHEAQSAR